MNLESPGSVLWNPHSLPFFLAAGVMLAAAVLIYRWERGSRVSRHFLTFSLLFTSWAVTRGLLRLMPDVDTAVIAARYLFAGISLGLPPLLGFVLLVLRTRQDHRRLNRLNWIVGILLALLSVGSPWVVAGVRATPWGFEPAHGPLGVVLVGWVFLLILITARDAVRAFRHARPGSVARRRLGLFGASLAGLYLSNVNLLVGLGLDVYPFGLIGIVAFTLGSAYVTWRHGLTEVTAQFAAAEIAAMVRGALLILDAEGAVLFVNPQTARVLGLRQPPPPGTRLSVVLGDAVTPQNLVALAALEGDSEHEIVHVPEHGAGARHLGLSVSALRDLHGRVVAFVCVVRDVTDHRRALEQRATGAARDPLTGLPNRTVFMELLDAVLRQPAAAARGACSVFVVGLDRLRVINEDLGYSAGDQVLVDVARRLTALVAGRPDPDSCDRVGRVGGDEFALLIHHAGAADPEPMLNELDAILRAPLRLADHEVFIGASIGVATSTVADAGDGSGADLLRRASIAMFRVKEQGGGGRHVYAPDGSQPQRPRLEAELRRAVERRELAVHYQPVVDLDTREIAGFEALVRWPHPRHGLLAPAQFLDLAQSAGLMAAIDDAVLERACRDLRRLRDLAPERRLFVSVNQSGDALARPAMAALVRHQLERHGLEPAALRIELLESTVLTAGVKETLAGLDSLGVGICSDDFGTGHSSLSRLHEAPIGTVKIDRSFVRAMNLGGEDRIVKAIVTLALSLGLDVIAEGVTHPGQARQLRELGCRRVQGYLFSPPVPFDQACALLAACGAAPGEPAGCPA